MPNTTLLLVPGVLLMLGGTVLTLSGLGVLGRRPDGTRPTVDATRVALGGLLDVAGMALIVWPLVA